MLKWLNYTQTVRDVVRNRNLFQSIQDKIHQKKRGKTAPPELPNLAIHGITFNGTYFFCTLIYQKDLSERKKITIFNLIDAYANTEEHAERIKLKAQIQKACGEQVESIALLFSNSSERYGFVTGNKVKVARWRDKISTRWWWAIFWFGTSLKFKLLVFCFHFRKWEEIYPWAY